MTRFLLSFVLLASLYSFTAGVSFGAEKSARPNILLILIDDLGWMDLRCQGNKRVLTPNIDRLAAEGMRFTDAYSAAPVCSPTRASILTGMAPARLQITNHIPDQKRFIPENPKLLPAAMLDHLPLRHETLAERFKKAGYATGFFGKWHLSGRTKARDQGAGDRRFAPEAQGFDVNVGGCAYGGPPTFFDPYRIHNLPSRKEGEYLPDRLADEVEGFIETHRQTPFFVALWNYTVHWPMEAPEAYLAKYRDQKVGRGFKDHRYVAMIEAMDVAMGRLFKALARMQLTKKTIVVFTSDNGAYLGVADMSPLRQGKGYLYEGGIRVPLIVRWPGRVKPGRVCGIPVVSTDLYPTLLDAAGLFKAEDRGLDGVSLVPLLDGIGPVKRTSLYFHYPNYAFHRSNRLGGAIREGDYKLIEYFDDGSVELYDLRTDIGEANNLAASLPEKAGGMLEKLRKWRKDVGAAMPVAP